MDTEIKPGDVVVLKSDSECRLIMVVESVYDNKVIVCWYVEPNSNKIVRDERNNGIPFIVLKKIT